MPQLLECTGALSIGRALVWAPGTKFWALLHCFCGQSKICSQRRAAPGVGEEISHCGLHKVSAILDYGPIRGDDTARDLTQCY